MSSHSVGPVGGLVLDLKVTRLKGAREEEGGERGREVRRGESARRKVGKLPGSQAYR